MIMEQGPSEFFCNSTINLNNGNSVRCHKVIGHRSPHEGEVINGEYDYDTYEWDNEA